MTSADYAYAQALVCRALNGRGDLGDRARMHDRRGTASLIAGPVAPLHVASLQGSRLAHDDRARGYSEHRFNVRAGWLRLLGPRHAVDPHGALPAGAYQYAGTGPRPHASQPWSPSRDGDRGRLLRYRAGGTAEQGRLAHDLADAQLRAGSTAGGRAREQALPAWCRATEPAARGACLSRSGTRRLRFLGGALAWAGTGDRGLAGRRAWTTHRDRVCRQGPRPT